MPPRAVIFDLGNVLIDWDMKPHFRPHFDTDEAMQQFLDWFGPLFITHVHDQPHDMTTCLAPVKAEYPEHRHLFEIMEFQWTEFIKGPIFGTVEILNRLDDQATPLFALTNWPHQVWPPRGPEGSDPADHDYSFLDRFRDIVVSGQVCMRKPNEDIYLHALDKFGLEASGAVFVDDLPENIETANRLGMKGLQFVGPTKLEEDLKELGLL